jgi:(R,R)-butanediol dehydrogenase / meso-butanediol dehydrogenase / diacetyl reductase
VLAAVYHGRRDVRVEEIAPTPDPAPGELLLEVARAAICGTDAGEWAHGPHMISLESSVRSPGKPAPVVLGHEFVGRVIAVGDGANGFAVGDRVVSGAGVSCGRCPRCLAGRTNLCDRYYTLGFNADGGLAETVLTPASICHAVPEECTDEAAAIAQPLAVAIHALSRAGLRPGDDVVIVGAGGIGSQLVAAAAGLGARAVAADVDDRRLDAAAALGAVETVNSERDSLPGVISELNGEVGAPVVIEASGTAGGLATALRTVARGGTVVAVGMPPEHARIDLVEAIVREVDIVTSVAHVCDQDLPTALNLLAKRGIAERVIERTITLGRVVDDGLLPLAEHRAGGKIVVAVQQ